MLTAAVRECQRALLVPTPAPRTSWPWEGWDTPKKLQSLPLGVQGGRGAGRRPLGNRSCGGGETVLGPALCSVWDPPGVWSEAFLGCLPRTGGQKVTRGPGPMVGTAA